MNGLLASKPKKVYDITVENFFGGTCPILLHNSGLDMIRDVRERVEEFLEEGDDYYDTSLFYIKHLGLTMEQVKELNPPPNPAKITDPRAKWYIAKYGKSSWEIEALKPKYLINLIETAILEHMDADKYNAWLKQEEEEKEDMRKFAKQYKDRGKLDE